MKNVPRPDRNEMGRPALVCVALNIDSSGKNTGVLLGKPLSINYELCGLRGHLRLTDHSLAWLAQSQSPIFSKVKS